MILSIYVLNLKSNYQKTELSMLSSFASMCIQEEFGHKIYSNRIEIQILIIDKKKKSEICFLLINGQRCKLNYKHLCFLTAIHSVESLICFSKKRQKHKSVNLLNLRRSICYICDIIPLLVHIASGFITPFYSLFYYIPPI